MSAVAFVEAPTRAVAAATENETTYILEYYRNGGGYTEPETQDF